MSKATDSNNNITAEELFRNVRTILTDDTLSGAFRNRIMHETLVLACQQGLKGTGQAFGNLFSQVDYLCRAHHMSTADTAAVQRMRRDSNRTSQELLPEELLYDCKALALFVSAVFGEAVPDFLSGKLPAFSNKPQKRRHIDYRCVRCIVNSFNEQTIEVLIDQDARQQLWQVDYTAGHLCYLKDLLRPEMQLNLLDCAVDEQGRLLPSLVVIEPDYLIDISRIARCFQDYGHHPLSYLINQMKPVANSQAILLGNFAGSALDEIVNPDGEYHWQDTFRHDFKEKALNYSTCPDLDEDEFRKSAEQQTRNIQQAVDSLFGTYDRHKALLEPSFLCERLGLQGRTDLMTDDLKLLVEQKAGKNYNLERGFANEHGSYHKEDHYVQLLLYFGVLKYNFDRTPSNTDMRLLYSRYPMPMGLLTVNYYQKLFYDAIEFRNKVVWTEFHIALHGFGSIWGALNADRLLEDRSRERFFNQYVRPRVDEVTAPLHALSELERHYYCRMMTFVFRERLSARLGAQEGQGNPVADLWNMPLAEKKESGNIYTGLTIVRKERSADYNGYDTITLDVPDQGDDFLPNFRTGDFVYLYAYRRDEEPDVRRHILFKGVLAEISSRQIVVHLSDGQRNVNALHGDCFAVEHSDVNSFGEVRSLQEFASSSPDRRALLLSQRAPRVDKSRSLSRSYNAAYDDMLLKAKQALDYFLLIGPPGTGKTSMALQYMVSEALAGADTSVLLLAYTNRAVDEICGMLEDNGIDYLRVGQEFSCDKRYRPHLLQNVLEHINRLDEIRAFIQKTRVFVATTTTMGSNTGLFGLKHFQLAIVDEASQILEPNIIGLLASHLGIDRTGCPLPCIDKFILIGDYKQLPAVVQQEVGESEVAEPDLRAIELTNCRNSLFERLIRWEAHEGRSDFVGVLHCQGRMHPEVAAFPVRMFYAEEQLRPVPLPHQQAGRLDYPSASAEDDALDRALKGHRVLFFPSAPCRLPNRSDKVNMSEASLVSHILERLYRYYGPAFDAQRTVGVIVPYRNQIATIRQEVELTGIKALNDVCIDTVERYQGSQRDVIIYSFTVQSDYQLDFLTANCFRDGDHIVDRKLNVVMTRARTQLILTGNEEVLRHNALFASLIDEVRAKGGYIKL